MAWLVAGFLRHTQVMMGVGAALLGVGSMYSHTLGISRYRRIVEQYKDDQPQALDVKTAELAEKVLFSIPLSVEEEAGIDFFTVYGQETCHRGSCKLRTGAIIGLPGTFAYESKNQVQTELIQVNNAPVDWKSRGGEILLKSIVLSDKAKAFAIAREVQYANTHHVWIDAGLKSGFMICAYSLGFWINQTFRLRSTMKGWGRVGVYGFIGTMVYLMYMIIDDTYYCRRDYAVDKRAVALGKEYAEGGLEFYTMLLQRNMALRLLLGSEGELLYTVYGNEVHTWRRPHATLTERRDYFVKHLNQLNEHGSANVFADKEDLSLSS